jgi:hypothetical protein
MAYTKKVWTDRTVERPLTYIQQDNGDGTITLIPSEGSIISSGTPITAANLNNIEDGISNAHIDIADINEYKKILTKYDTAIKLDLWDFNNITEAGLYTVNSTVNAPPKSTINPDKWFYVEVITHDDGNNGATKDWILQKATDFRQGTYIRRRNSAGWETWVRLDADKQQIMQLWGGGGGFSANTWRRVGYDNASPNIGGFSTDANTDMFAVPETGWYMIDAQYQITQSVGTAFWLEVWGNPSAPIRITNGYAECNGWNQPTGFNLAWLDQNIWYEFVMKHADGGYVRNMGEFKATITRM